MKLFIYQIIYHSVEGKHGGRAYLLTLTFMLMHLLNVHPLLYLDL